MSAAVMVTKCLTPTLSPSGKAITHERAPRVFVMTGLGPVIHGFDGTRSKFVDGRDSAFDRPGHDVEENAPRAKDGLSVPPVGEGGRP